MVKKYVLITLLLAITIYSRFINLNWDRGWGFHPDENNLWGASRQIKLFSKIDPQFYAYGGFPIYLYSFLDSKVQARAISALLQTAIIGLLFITGRKLNGFRTGLLAALMGIFSAGLVQASHFLTVESLLGFFSLLLVLELVEVCETSSQRAQFRKLHMALAVIVLGLGIGTKISFAVFALPVFAILLRPGLFKKAGPFVAVATVFLAIFIFILTNPFILSKFQDVRSTLKYETNVALGNLPVFYTRQFTGTVPGLFQTVHIFPFIASWLFVPIFLIGAFVICFKEFPCRKIRRLLIISIFAALLSFIPFWAKWTRYVVQVFPALILVAGIGLSWLWEKGKIGKAVVVLTIISFLPQFFSIIKVYVGVDNRLATAEWAAVNLPRQAKIFTEGMDLGIIPFNPVHGENITLLNFYELDEDKTGQRQILLNTLINENEYFISVSNRVYGNSLRLQNRFSASAEFYRQLFDGSLKYKKIYEAIAFSFFFLPPSSPYSPEETFQVFDHPTVMIFERTLKH